MSKKFRYSSVIGLGCSHMTVRRLIGLTDRTISALTRHPLFNETISPPLNAQPCLAPHLCKIRGNLNTSKSHSRMLRNAYIHCDMAHQIKLSKPIKKIQPTNFLLLQTDSIRHKQCTLHVIRTCNPNH